MTVTRRAVLRAGGGILAALSVAPMAAAAADVIHIRMQGRPDGSRVWFDPIGIRVRPGQTLRWTNMDAGNSHTSTSYHPDLFGRVRRIPERAKPWNSDYLLPKESFSVTLTEEGVYDYYCIPHELAGMVGRIVVGSPRPDGWFARIGQEGRGEDVPQKALKAFPAVEEIMKKGIVRRA